MKTTRLFTLTAAALLSSAIGFAQAGAVDALKKFNNDANMIKKNNKMGGISFKYSRGECQKLDEKYRLSTILFIRYAFWE